MDKLDYETLKSGDASRASDVLHRFVEQYSNTFDFGSFNQYGQWTPIWKAIFTFLRQPIPNDDLLQIYPDCLAAIRILSRDKTYLNQSITSEQFDSLLNIAKIGNNNLNIDNPAISVEALKCLCNLVFQSTECQAMCLKNAAIEGIVKRLRTYKDHNIVYELQYFDMKLLFLITALNPNVRTKVRDDFHGLTYLVETLDLIIKENVLILENGINQLPDAQVDLLGEILKVLFNISVRNETSVATEEEEEIQFRRLAVILHDLLLCQATTKDKQLELCSNTINLLTNVPTACYSELVVTMHMDTEPIPTTSISSPSSITSSVTSTATSFALNNIENQFEGCNVAAINALLEYLKCRLDNIQKLNVQQELLSPVLTVLIKCVRCSSLHRRYIRSQVLPPLRDVRTRPEVGTQLRNYLCRLLTTPTTQVRDLVAEFLFILCKENVNRMVKYTGYGNAAGLFANRGLLGGHNASGCSSEYSSDSDDSDTEEYKQMQHEINPVLGCYEPPRPSPFEGMTDEQKEYETMKLVNLMDKLNRQGIIQPTRIGPDGRPEPVEHILQLQDGIPQQQFDHQRKT